MERAALEVGTIVEVVSKTVLEGVGFVLREPVGRLLDETSAEDGATLELVRVLVELPRIGTLELPMESVLATDVVALCKALDSVELRSDVVPSPSAILLLEIVLCRLWLEAEGVERDATLLEVEESLE